MYPCSSHRPGGRPQNQFYLQSSWDIGDRWELDLTGATSTATPSTEGWSRYIVGDARLAWHARKNLELSVVGRNLFNGNFYEYGNDSYLGAQATEVQPEVYGQIVWRR